MCKSIAATRHDAVDVHIGYTKPDKFAHGKRYRAIVANVVFEKPEPHAMNEEAYPKVNMTERKMAVQEWEEYHTLKKR